MTRDQITRDALPGRVRSTSSQVCREGGAELLTHAHWAVHVYCRGAPVCLDVESRGSPGPCPTTAVCVCGEVHLTFPSPSVRCGTSLGSNSPPREGYAIDLAPPPRRRGLLTAPGRRQRNSPTRGRRRRAPPRRSRQREPLPRCVASVSALRAQTGAPGWSGVTARAPSREV